MRVRCSITLPLILMFQAVLPAPAQANWESIAKAASDLRAPDCYVLVSSPPALEFQWYGEDPLAEADLREFRRVTLELESAEALAKIKGGPGWVLFNPKGERVDDGVGVPTPSRIRETMEKAGWKPLREALQEHLRRHPGDGQAQVELAFLLARHGRDRKYAGTLSRAWVERLRGELLPPLRALADTPELEQGLAEARPQPFGPTVAALWVAELDKDPEIGDAVKRLFAVVPPQLARDPENRSLWVVRDYSHREGDGTEDGPTFLASLEGVPGQPWPPTFLETYLQGWYRKDPVRLAIAATGMVDQNLKPSLVARLGRPQIIQTLETWGELHLEGLVRLRQMDEALAYLGWMRVQSGRAWPQVSSRLSKALQLVAAEDGSGPKGEETLEYLLSAAQKVLLQTALATAPLPDPSLPTSEPLRLALLDGESFKRPWEELQRHPALALWDATEVSWVSLRPKEIDHLKGRYSWPSGVRWVLLQGDQMLVSQAGFPTIQTIESALWAQGIPQLEILGAWIKAHPDRMDARRGRVRLLQPRLPNPTLERIFLEDLEALEAAPGPLNFKPDPDLWGPVARRIIFRLTERISHWPFQEANWKAYVAWTGLIQKPPPPVSVLAGIETFPYQLGVRVPGPLPAAISLGVVKSLEDQNRFLEVDAWMQILWERGLKSWLSTWVSLPALPSKSSGGWLDRAAPDVQKLFAVWGRALRKSGRTKALGSLRWELESLKPGLGNLLGGESH